MNFFQGIINKFNEMKQDAIEKKAFMDLVRAEKKPFQRAAYMKQALKDAVEEGKQKAILDSSKNKVQQPKTKEDFGIGLGLEDPYKFLRDKSKLNKGKSK